MAYCTLEDIQYAMDEDDVIRFTDDHDSGAVDTAVVDKAIADTGSLVDAYLASRYAVPLDPVPAVINGAACDIAIYKISSRRGIAAEEVRKKFEDAVKFLEKLAAGKAVLPGVDESTSGGTDMVRLTSDIRVFSRNSMRGF